MVCKHGLLAQCCDECIAEKIEIATLVYLSLEADGFYGPYALGDELWSRFKDVFDDTPEN
jgi:hypothetical protein